MHFLVDYILRREPSSHQYLEQKKYATGTGHCDSMISTLNDR